MEQKEYTERRFAYHKGTKTRLLASILICLAAFVVLAVIAWNKRDSDSGYFLFVILLAAAVLLIWECAAMLKFLRRLTHSYLLITPDQVSGISCPQRGAASPFTVSIDELTSVKRTVLRIEMMQFPTLELTDSSGKRYCILPLENAEEAFNILKDR